MIRRDREREGWRGLLCVGRERDRGQGWGRHNSLVDIRKFTENGSIGWGKREMNGGKL